MPPRTLAAMDDPPKRPPHVPVGDWVEVIRAGEVIPQVVRSLPDRRELDDEGRPKQKKFEMPDECPDCGTVPRSRRARGELVELPLPER